MQSFCKSALFFINPTQQIYKNGSKFKLNFRTAMISAIKQNNPVKSSIAFQEELLSEAVNNKVPSIKEWLNIKRSILSQGKCINEVNFDAKVLAFCIHHKNYEAGKNFMEFIQSNNTEINVASVGKFMKLFHTCNEREIRIKDEEFILSMYYNLKKKYPVMASITAENLIYALSLTKEWKECLELLENLKITITPTCVTYSVIIKAAFQNNETKLGWRLIEEMISKSRLPTPIVYNEWITKLKEDEKNLVKNIENLFKFFSENEILPTKETTDKILEALKNKKYFGSYTNLSKKGLCLNCKKQLDHPTITDEEFEKLKSVFIDNVLIGKNIFNKTTPTELNRFKKFLEDSAPYDIVIDGLNVAYSTGIKNTPHVYAKLLSNVVHHYRNNSKKVLVLGRLHMHKWPQNFMSYVKSNASIFLADNLSQDDPFLLYATMYSGLGTKFLSKDFMRGHLYLLMDSNLKNIFRKWQQLHQETLININHNGTVHVKPPFPVLSTTQGCTENGWHIPYLIDFKNSLSHSLDPPKNWLCLRKNG